MASPPGAVRGPGARSRAYTASLGAPHGPLGRLERYQHLHHHDFDDNGQSEQGGVTSFDAFVVGLRQGESQNSRLPHQTSQTAGAALGAIAKHSPTSQHHAATDSHNQGRQYPHLHAGG